MHWRARCGNAVFHTMLYIPGGKLRSCDRWEFLEDVSELVTSRAGIEAGCRYFVLLDGYALVRFGIDDVASVDVNEKVVAAEEIGTQHRALDIGENKRPCELTEAQV